MKNALKIYEKLLKDGQINSITDRELFIEYRKEEVRDLLREFEEELHFYLLEVGQTVYLVPKLENDLMSFSMRQYRESISSSAALIDAYLQAYISMTIFYMFYGGKNNNPIQREFLGVNELVKYIDSRMNSYKRDVEDTLFLEEDAGINFTKIAEYWSSKIVSEEGKLKTKIGTVIKSCKQLENEKLIKLVDDNRQIRPTKRLQDIFINYYLSENRVQEIHKILDREVTESAETE